MCSLVGHSRLHLYFLSCSFFFLFNDTATTEIYTFSLHDALPILADEINRTPPKTQAALLEAMQEHHVTAGGHVYHLDRKSTRLNSSHTVISYAVFCLKKKKIKI